MPSAADLPPSLVEFSRCQAVELSDTRWRYDVDRLVEMLQVRFAIESEPAPLTSAGDGPAGALTRLAADLIELVLHPKRLIARRQTGRASDAARALGFLAAAILVGNVILRLSIDMPALAARSPALRAGSMVGWLLAGLFVGIVFAGLLVAPLALAWRIVDRGARYRRVGLVSAYVYGGAWLGFCTGIAVLGAGVQLVDPGFFGRVVDWVTAAAAGAAPAPAPAIHGFGGAALGVPATIVVLLGYAILIGSLLWAIAAWGGFRQSFGATRLQSWLATSLWLACLAALGWLAVRLG